MQLVGRTCALCGQKLRAEAGAVGCARCDLVVHRACARPGSAGASGYREHAEPATAEPGAPCPRCGDDLDARAREEDAERDRILAEVEARRRRRARPLPLFVRVLIVLALIAVAPFVLYLGLGLTFHLVLQYAEHAAH